MPLNPDMNLFSVAPIGHIIMIGRANALKGGLSREYAINLLTWLTIATGANPEEICEEIAKACTETAGVTVRSPAVRNLNGAPKEAIAYIGDIDAEEKEAIDAVVQQEAAKSEAVTVGRQVLRPQKPAPEPPKVTAVDVNSLAKSWTPKGQNNG